jgi:transaldolase
MSQPNLKKLADFGQSPWLDDLSAGLVRSGQLDDLVNLGLRGLTSNPTIFDKAISSGEDGYPQQIAERKSRSMEPLAIYEELTIGDIIAAADVLMPVHKATNGDDGFVSLEVDPALAHDTDRTVAEATRLFRKIDRSNLMIKVPATEEGIVAVEELIAAGVNVNVTLIFSRPCYEQVARAYVQGLQRRLDAGESVADIRSVASVFVSRVDTVIDKQIAERLAGDEDEETRAALEKLRGQAAVANTRLIYQDFKRMFLTDGFGGLQKLGAAIQRPLWGSTSTKNPDYPDLKYVEPLIGPHTVNTMPTKTLEALLDYGQPEAGTIEHDLSEACRALDELDRLEIDLPQALEDLQTAGVRAFADSFNSLIETIKNA